MKPSIAILLMLTASVNPCRAILNDMVLTEVEVVGKDENAPTPNEGWSDVGCALFKFDVDKGGNVINGHKITAIWNSNGIIKPRENDHKYDAYANAEVGNRPKSITLHHPDFNNYNIVFADVPAIGSVESGVIYKISLKIPSPKLIEANSAYNNMNFGHAKALYQQIADGRDFNKEEKIIARNQLTDIDSLASWTNKAVAQERAARNTSGKERNRALYRAKIYYNTIFRRHGIINAGLKIDELDRLLGLKAKAGPSPSFNRLKLLSAENIPNSSQAKGNDAVHYDFIDKKGRKEKRAAALLIIEVPLGDAKITSPRSVKPVEYRDGEYWLYVKTEVEKKDNPVLFTINHPDFMPYEFRLKDFGNESTLEHQSTYRIKLDTPSLVMTMANKHLGRLNLEEARNFFHYNYADADEQAHADRCLGFLESPTVRQIANDLDGMVKKWRKVDKEYFSIISGATTFNTQAERTRRLDYLNREIEEQAGKLADSYRRVYYEASRNGSALEYARDLAEEYGSYCEGVRRLPLIIEFEEVDKMNNGIYTTPRRLSSQPTVRIEILDDDNKVIDRIEQKVKDDKVSWWVNVRASRLFKQGRGKIRVKDLNHDPAYNNTELKISNFRIEDYSTKKLNIALVKN